MRTFLINYHHEGYQYALKLRANDAVDAKARLNSLLYGRVIGEVAVVLPAPLSPFVQLVCYVRNALAQVRQ